MNRTNYASTTAFTICLILVALAPSAQATTAHADLDVEAIHFQGDTQTNAGLVGLFLDRQYGTGLAWPNFTLDASQLRIETDYADPVASIEGNHYNHDAKVETSTYSSAHVVGLAFQDDYETTILPAYPNRPPTIEIQESCSSWNPPDAESVVRTAWVRPGARPDLVADTEHSTRWASCTATSITVAGDFLVAMRGHHARLTTPEEAAVLQSGRLPSEQSPHPATNEAVYRYQQLYLHATNATLQIPLVPGEYGLYAAQATAHADGGTVSLQNANGPLRLNDELLDLGGDRISLTGDLDLRVTNVAHEAPMQLQLDGDVGSAYRNGQPLTSNPVIPTPSVDFLAWTLAAALAATILVAWAGSWLRQLRIYKRTRGKYGTFIDPIEASNLRERRAAGLWVQAAHCLELNQYGRALRRARGACKLDSSLGRAWFTAASAARQLTRLDQADQYYKRAAEVFLTPDGVGHALLGRARIAALQQRAQDATRWWREALSLSPLAGQVFVYDEVWNGLSRLPPAIALMRIGSSTPTDVDVS